VLSDTAKEFANALGVRYSENFSLKRYPIVKCNVSSSGMKIYHLPFDQQYDNTKIKEVGEFYAMVMA
jgi:predicted transcriptional regulator with HTH domain